MKIHVKWKIGSDNEWLDLSQYKVKFNIDHLFRLPGTTRSLVFFPYYIYADQIDEFNKYCKANHYKMDFVGGESVYGGKSDFTNGTMTIVLIHENDDDSKVNLLEKLDQLQDYPE